MLVCDVASVSQHWLSSTLGRAPLSLQLIYNPLSTRSLRPSLSSRLADPHVEGLLETLTDALYRVVGRRGLAEVDGWVMRNKAKGEIEEADRRQTKSDHIESAHCGLLFRDVPSASNSPLCRA